MLRTQIEKQINILDYALSSIWRRKFKNISVMLVFGAVIFLLASFQMVTQALTEAAADSLVAAPEITLQRMSAGRQEAIPLAYRDRLASIFGIRKIVPRIWGYYFDETHLANYTVMGLDTSTMPQGGLLNQALASGRFPRADENDGVVVGQSIVALKKLADRRLFSLFRPDLSLKPVKMLGVFNDKTDLLTNDLIVINPAEIETIAKKIAKILPDTRVVTRPQVQKTYQVVFGWRSGFGSICLLTALAAFVILAWDKASGLTPEEKREIGILKILGWETADILAIRFWESFWVAGIAFVVGCTLAYIHVAFFGAALFRPVMIGWSVIYPVFRLPPSISFADLLLIFCFSVMPYLAATIIPAWRSATVPPDAAIR
jgi:cell division protein FtsX